MAEIILYVFHQSQDLKTAQQLEEKILLQCSRVGQTPGMGAPYLRNLKIKKVLSGPYQIFYRYDDVEVIILRIWDGRRGLRPRFNRG